MLTKPCFTFSTTCYHIIFGPGSYHSSALLGPTYALLSLAEVTWLNDLTVINCLPGQCWTVKNYNHNKSPPLVKYLWEQTEPSLEAHQQSTSPSHSWENRSGWQTCTLNLSCENRLLSCCQWPCSSGGCPPCSCSSFFSHTSDGYIPLLYTKR